MKSVSDSESLSSDLAKHTRFQLSAAVSPPEEGSLSSSSKPDSPAPLSNEYYIELSTKSIVDDCSVGIQ